MKKFIPLTLAALGLLSALPARAWNYNAGDLLLVFRNGTSDVEFNLGTVSNYLGHAAGYTTVVTGWNPTLVTGAFGSTTNLGGFPSLSGVDVVLLAVTGTPQTAWLSGAEPNTTAYTVGSSAWTSSLYGTINSVGIRPITYNAPATTNANSSATNSYVLSATALSSYDTAVSGGTSTGLQDITQLGGKSAFTVETALPADLDFWAISPSSAPTKPADQLVGRFELSSSGVLTFIAGPRPASLQGLTRNGNVSTVSFTTTVGNAYTLAHTNRLTAAPGTWPVDTITNIGDGNVDTLTHTNSGAAELYEVIAH